MAKDEKYFNFYDELSNLLCKAYIDVYALREVQRYNDSVKSGGDALLKSSSYFIGHICELLKADLGLTVWKVFSDEDQRANTIRHLSQYLHEYFEEHYIQRTLPKFKLPEEMRSTLKKLSELRDTFLAHNDTAKIHEAIKLVDIINLLGFITKTLNALCFEEIDERVSPITNNVLKSIEFDVSFGFGLIINKRTFPINRNAQEDSD